MDPTALKTCAQARAVSLHMDPQMSSDTFYLQQKEDTKEATADMQAKDKAHL